MKVKKRQSRKRRGLKTKRKPNRYRVTDGLWAKMERLIPRKVPEDDSTSQLSLYPIKFHVRS